MKKRLSYSALSNFGKSPNHLLRYWSKKFVPTSAMMLGSLIHKIILEPDTFDLDYAVFEGTRRGKVWEGFKAENEGKELVTIKEYDIANYVVEQTKSNKIFMDLLMRTSETEKEIRWNCKGVDFKGLVDMVGNTFIADIKTTVLVVLAAASIRERLIYEHEEKVKEIKNELQSYLIEKREVEELLKILNTEKSPNLALERITYTGNKLVK